MPNSDGHDTDEQVIVWGGEPQIGVDVYHYLTDFSLTEKEFRNVSTKTNTGEFSFILLNLFFQRWSSYYLKTFYIPSAMLVVVSWFSFLISSKNQLLKTAICLFSLGTLTLMLAILEKELPHVHYTKAIDVWTGVCLTFIFAALVESVVVHYRNRNKCGFKKKEAGTEEESNKLVELTDQKVSVLLTE